MLGHVDGFGVMSGGSDFMPIATRIRQNGLSVHGFGLEKTLTDPAQLATLKDLLALEEERSAAWEAEQGRTVIVKLPLRQPG